ncbi:hypothetical protein [Amycolatopsis antarctica]|uniref:hypothetical protein n=1 Tax=Amycolatopsis antarctica TaxID=1854586 RepID=UPI001054693C|nr:hypothetical protein [Amycolatopsis antarctica]
MTKKLSQRAAAALVMVFTVAFLGAGAGVASAGPVDRAAEVGKMQAEYAKTVTADEYTQAVSLYGRMLATERTPSGADSQQVGQVAGGEFCGTIPKEAGIAYGWYLKVRGAVTGVGAFVVGGVNIPAGAVVAALGLAEGLSGDAAITWSEENLPKKVCVTWS